MAGGYTTPRTGDFGELIERLANVERRLVELERPTGTQNVKAVVQLNNASESKSASSGFITESDITTPITNYFPATVTFTRPSWATRATILAAGSIYIAGSLANSFTATSALRIGGVNGQNVPNFFVPRRAGVWDASDAYTGNDAIIPDAVRSSVFSRTFDVASATVDVSWRVNISAAWGVGEFLWCDTVATVFWSAP